MPLWAWSWLFECVRGTTPPTYDEWLLWHWQVVLGNDLPVIVGSSPAPRSRSVVALES